MAGARVDGLTEVVRVEQSGICFALWTMGCPGGGEYKMLVSYESRS